MSRRPLQGHLCAEAEINMSIVSSAVYMPNSIICCFCRTVRHQLRNGFRLVQHIILLNTMQFVKPPSSTDSVNILITLDRARVVYNNDYLLKAMTTLFSKKKIMHVGLFMEIIFHVFFDLCDMLSTNHGAVRFLCKYHCASSRIKRSKSGCVA